MRIFSSCKEALDEIVRDLFSRGVECFDPTVQARKVDSASHSAKELIGYCYRIVEPSKVDAAEMINYANRIFNKQHLSVEYGEDWLQDMIKGGLNPEPAHLKHWATYWKKFSEISETGKFAYTYSERIKEPLKITIERLKDSKYRRAAYIPIWYEKDIYRIGKRRVPCSLGYHFLVRKEGFRDKLHLMYMQRSCSLAEFYPLDVYRAVGLLEYISNETNIPSGDLVHFISSLHCFYKDLRDLNRMW